MSTSAERPYLSIGEVLELLKEEFPDVSISRIRMLEAQSLLQLERTASGYRKFYDADVTHLRAVLRQHGASDPSAPSPARGGRPPAVIDLDAQVPRPSDRAPGASDRTSDRPEPDGDDEGVDLHAGELPGQPERRHPASFNTPRRPAAVARSTRTHPASGVPGSSVGFPAAPEQPAGQRPATDRPGTEASDGPVTDSTPNGAPHDGPGGESADAGELVEHAVDTSDAPTSSPTSDGVPRLALVSSTPSPQPPTATGPTVAAEAAVPAPDEAVGPMLGSRNPLLANPSALSLSLDDLCRAAGVVAEQVRELESYGLLRGHSMFSTVYYDEDALLTCRLVAEFLRFGVEPRHLRMYKLATDREAAFFEQVVTPQLRRRNPDAKERAIETLGELVRLGEQLRVVALRQVLRAAVDPS